MKFAAVGFVCVDVYQNLGVRYPTGNGIDLMFNLMDLMPDIEPAVIAAVGDDDHGRMLLDICEKKHVDTSHVRIVKGGTTPTVEMRMNGTDRVHYHTERGVAECYQPTGEEMDFIRKQEVIHTDLSWHVTDLLPDMRKSGTQIYFDFSKRYQHPDVPKILRNIQYGMFSFEEETEEVRELLRMGCGLGAKILLATFGEQGSLAYDGSTFYREPCIKADNMVNTVGAGDSFGAGFLSGILQGKTIPEAMRAGAAKAAEIVQIFKPYHTPET